MAYLAVNKNGKEIRFDGKYRPFRCEVCYNDLSDGNFYGNVLREIRKP